VDRVLNTFHSKPVALDLPTVINLMKKLNFQNRKPAGEYGKVIAKA
jgi:hypothetical protein